MDRRMHGHHIPHRVSRPVGRDHRSRLGLRATSATHGDAMTGWDIVGGLIAVALLVYLVAVLLRPEDFS